MTSTRRLHSAALGLAFSGILALTACGGDDSSSDTTQPANAEATTDDTSTTDDTTTTDDTSTDSTTEDSAEDSTDTTFDTSDVEALTPEECREVYAQFQALGFDIDSGEEPEDIDAAFEAIRDAVPDDLKEDVDTLAEAYSKLRDLTSNGTPDVTDPEYLEALEELNSPEIQEASARLSTHFENCDEATGGD